MVEQHIQTKRQTKYSASMVHFRSLRYYLTWATYNMVSQRHGPTSTKRISGTLLDDNNLSYNVQQSYGTKGKGNGGSASLNYRGGGNMNFGYNYSKDSRQLNYGVEGGVLIHGDGVTLSQPINETAILVKASGAANTNVTGYTGVFADWRGFAYCLCSSLSI
ncbi:fimbria/pilus outer membrane usher protein [Providencia rettgeri]|uniref:Fimbria/pilus outer membrane usher protein n=1 Tax=Providencia rettgeri TaxID=587 RepID=A0A939NB94_PRORE|nr:fimbria/pilus outer membrane usher protein [Providencia rettgeri]